MRVADLQIRNFRGVRDGYVRLGPHTVLTGPSNVGKTTLIESLALLFGRDRLIRELTEHDFTGSSPEVVDRIVLIATVTDFNTQNPDDHLDWFRDGRGVTKYLDAASGKVHPAQDDPAWTLCCQIGFQARFDRDDLVVETVRYFHDDDAPIDPFAGDAHVVVPTRLIQSVGFYLVRASRTWDGVISFGSELFRRTVAAAHGQPASAVLAERDRLRDPQYPIEEDDQLRPLVDSINVEMARFLPRSPQLKLRVTATDSRGVLESVVAHYGSRDVPILPVSRHGSGLISLQGLLLLLQFGRARIEAGEGFLMALEEPELHLPPPGQSRLVRRIQALSRQTIITTHSPAIAAAADPTAVLVLRNDSGRLAAEPLLQETLRDDAQNWLRRFFLTGRQTVIAALMHEIVLVPEGRSDQALLQAIASALDLREGWAGVGEHFFTMDVGLVPTEDAKVLETYALLARLHGRICCLVDGNGAGDSYTTALRQHPTPPARILRWPDGWSIEETVGWILHADEPSLVARLDIQGGPPTSAADVVGLMQRNKANLILYETLAEAIALTPACAARARELLAAIVAACTGEPTPRFAAHRTGALVFVP